MKILRFGQMYVNYLTHNYTYPSEDLCLFEHFPHKNLVIPSLAIRNEDIECSCTIIWLIQNHKTYIAKRNMSQDYEIYFKNFSVIRCLSNFSTQFDLCEFESKFKNCLNSSFTPANDELSVLQIFFVFEWLNLVIKVYMQTFLSLLGLLTNWLTIVTVKNKAHKKILDNVMYEHIFFNSCFNLCFCFLHSFSLINICIFPKSSFCSSVYKTLVAQYFKYVFELFLGNSLRLCCNFSFILFSMSRFHALKLSKNCFVSLANNFNSFLSKKLKLLYPIMFTLCSTWSTFKLFEYGPNEVYSSFDKNFPYNRFDDKYCDFADMGEYRYLAFGCRVFPMLNLINNVFNNILFLFVSVIIDIHIIRFTNEKYTRSKSLFHDQKHLDEAAEHRKKVRKLIVTNGVLYFFSHIPEFTFTLLLIVFKKEMKYFCYTFFSCTEINEIFQVFSLLSICLQFFVFKHFDSNFLLSFNDLKARFFTRAKKLFFRP
jgi:hypothetical protein